MEVQANYIKRIEIHGLWHRYDIAWDLRPDVNILSGINGVGKTTILNRSVNYLEQTSGEVKSDEKNGVPFAIVFTKADKLKGGRLNTHINEYLEQLKEQWEELPPYFITSSENRMGRKELLDYIESINKSLNSKQ